jgi:23S rRNA (uracil1939-C5)-methyltransferase
MVVFVWGPLPGEEARVRVVEVKKTYAVGTALEIVERSADRVEPFCPVFGTCGGCQVQHLAYPAQQAWKSRIVKDALQRIGGFTEVEVLPTIGMDDPRAYRNKMALVVQHRDGTQFGFYQMRSHDFVPIERCPIVLPQLDSQIAGLRDAAADPATGPALREVKHAIARAGSASSESVLALTTERPAQELDAAAPEIARRLDGAVGISNSFAPASANAVMGRKTRQLWGRAEMEERILLPQGGAARYRVSAASFFQVNSAMVGRIFAFMAEHLHGTPRVVDLYCGAGTFSIFFALCGAQVVGVEENPAAVREANANAVLNGVTERARFIAGRVESVLARQPGRAALAAADVAFLDPPRKGSDEPTLDALAAAGAPSIWYLSCNPSTLARDLARLRAAGYRLGIVQPFDLFPQTGHVETFVTLTKG